MAAPSSRAPRHLVRAALVCKQWSLLVSASGFRRRYQQRHRVSPVLGVVVNLADTGGAARFVPTRSAFRPVRADRHGYRAHDARHGCVLLNRIPAPQEDHESALAVWDPIAGELRPLPLLLRPKYVRSWNATVLCAAGPDADCDHLDCRRAGHFRVVFVGIDAKEMFAHAYSSESGAWSSEATTADLPGDDQLDVASPGVLAGDALYFSNTRILRCDPATREMSVLRLPEMHIYSPRIVLTAMEDGGLGFAQVDMSCVLRLWSRRIGPQQREDAGFWVISRAIDLKTKQLITPRTLLPTAHGALTFRVPPCVVVAFADGGAGVVFLKTDDGLYSFDVKSGEAVKVCMSSAFYDIVPYTSVYTPALRVASADEGPYA